MKNPLLIWMLIFLSGLNLQKLNGAPTGNDFIPPLPVDELKKIKIPFQDSIEPPYKIDSFVLFVSGGNVFKGQIRYITPVKKRARFALDFNIDKNFDYSDYWLWHGCLDYGLLIKNCWHEITFTHQRKKRLEPDFDTIRRNYHNIAISYNPTWFMPAGTGNLNTQIRRAQYFDLKQRDFYAVNPVLHLTRSSLLGIFHYTTDALFQTVNTKRTIRDIYINAGFNNLILLGDNFFIQPGVSYAFTKKLAGAFCRFGVSSNQTKTIGSFYYNQTKPLYFDTLFSRVLPYQIDNAVLSHPVCLYSANIQWSYHKFGILCGFEQYRSYLCLSAADSWIIPAVRDTLSEQMQVVINTQFPTVGRSLKIQNRFGINYLLTKMHLMPAISILDSLTINLNKFDIGFEFTYRDAQTSQNYTLPAYYLLSINLGYSYKILSVSAGIENILDKKFAHTPHKFNKGRKYLLGLGLKLDA